MSNVFEYLGLDPEHRKGSKIVQLVKHFDDIPEKKIHYPLIAQVKKDGVFGMLVVQQRQARMFGRTGKLLSSCDGFIDPISLADGVYIGEVCLPGKSLEVLSGMVNPNRTNALDAETEAYWFRNREFWCHDYLTLQEFYDGYSARSYSTRLHQVRGCGLPSINWVYVFTKEAVESFEAECVLSGEEGAVFKQDVDWVAGHKGWRSMKRVRSIEYDLLCVGSEEGTGKYRGKVANLILKWRGDDTIKAMLGKGWTHGDAERMHNDEAYFPEGKIFTVYGLQDSSKGKIRLPKVGVCRHDKDEADF